MSRNYTCYECYDNGKRYVLDSYSRPIAVPCICLVEKCEALLQKVQRLEAQADADPGNATVLKSANPASARKMSLNELRSTFRTCDIDAGRHYIVRDGALVDAGSYAGEEGWIAVRNAQVSHGLVTFFGGA